MKDSGDGFYNEAIRNTLQQGLKIARQDPAYNNEKFLVAISSMFNTNKGVRKNGAVLLQLDRNCQWLLLREGMAVHFAVSIIDCLASVAQSATEITLSDEQLAKLAEAIDRLCVVVDNRTDSTMQ